MRNLILPVVDLLARWAWRPQSFHCWASAERLCPDPYLVSGERIACCLGFAQAWTDPLSRLAVGGGQGRILRDSGPRDRRARCRRTHHTGNARSG